MALSTAPFSPLRCLLMRLSVRRASSVSAVTTNTCDYLLLFIIVYLILSFLDPSLSPSLPPSLLPFISLQLSYHRVNLPLFLLSHSLSPFLFLSILFCVGPIFSFILFFSFSSSSSSFGILAKCVLVSEMNFCQQAAERNKKHI